MKAVATPTKWPSRLYHFTDAANIDSIMRYGLIPFCQQPANMVAANRPKTLLDSVKFENHQEYVFLTDQPYREKTFHIDAFRGAVARSAEIVRIVLRTNWILHDTSFRYIFNDVCVTKSIVSPSEFVRFEALPPAEIGDRSAAIGAAMAARWEQRNRVLKATYVERLL